MPETLRCPECGTDLSGDSPEGLCPQCLLKHAWSNGSQDAASRETPTTGPLGPFAAPAPAELAGRFPHLEILEFLGQGGMGAVYKARQPKLDRLVAVKILPPEWGRDPAFAERFAREARALAKLSHPQIVAVHDFGGTGGLYYLVMEYVDGPNLRQLLDGRELTPEESLRIVPQVCDALQYAHEEGVVHRDIKPENILIDRKGRVKIADFGLAKLVGQPRPMYSLTGSRQVVGTLDYMAPEQRSRPQEVDHRADIYALGVVLYEMLTGELPLGRFDPPSQKVAVDQRLDGVVFRALAREPNKRYQRVSEVKAELEAVVSRASPPRLEIPPALIEGKGPDQDLDPLQVVGPAAGLLLTGIVGFLFWAIMGFGMFMEAQTAVYYRRGAAIYYKRDEALAFLLMPLLALPASLPLVIAAVNMMKCRRYPLAVGASLWAMVPWSPAWVLGLPFGIWALKSLRKPEVQTAFAASSRWRLPVVMPALGLLLTGVLTFVFWAVLGIVLCSNARGDDGVPFLLMPLLAFPLALVLVVGAVKMMRSQSYSFVVLASMWATVPWSPACLVGLPFGIWALLVLRRPEEQKAFRLAALSSPVAPPRPALDLPPQPRPPTGPVRGRLRSFLHSLRSIFVSRDHGSGGDIG
jgi:tRNA A-37 threonylcarbamoyl transferase component Bud32